MSGFFSRRRGSSAQPPVDRNTSSNAAIAATSAFRHTNTSTPALSSAAAAAALRSNTASPIDVGSIQTKRMARRGSQSSNTSAAPSRGGTPRPGVQRTNSSGSMTERTFRSPSPGRANGTMSPTPSGGYVPPVPPIPANAHKRATSNVAPQRITSPAPQPGKRGSSVDRPTITTNTAPQMATQQLSDVTEAEDGSPSSPSVNFSRPMSPAVGSATTKKYTHKNGPWFTGSTTPARPATADGTLYSRNAPSPINTNRANQAEPVKVYDPNTRSFVLRYDSQDQGASPTSPAAPTANTVYDANSRSFVPAQQTYTSPGPRQPAAQITAAKKTRPIPAPVNTDLEPPPRNPARLSPTTSSPLSPRAAGMLHKQPSVVREDLEGEEEAEAAGSATASPAAAIRNAQPAGLAKAAKTYTTRTAPHERSSSLDVPRNGSIASRGRTASTSPSRSAHFSSALVRGNERHVPPGRGISPAKSALKHSPASSVRTSSPIAVFSPSVSAAPPSETSEDTQSQDGFGSAGRKKKSVRVSFDEQPKQIDLEPVTPKPVPDFDDEDGELMKPRPALPSFGSVRNNRMHPDPAEKVTEMPPERNAVSSDHAIGGILRNSLEPIPPEVTSKESAGYISDESSDGEVPAVASAAVPAPATVGAGQEMKAESVPIVKDFATVTPNQEDQPAAPAEDLNVPAIALQPPTPGLDENAKRQLGEDEQEDVFETKNTNLYRNSMENIVVPGGWNMEDDSVDKDTVEPSAAQSAQVPQPAALARKSSTEDSAATQTLTPIEIPPVVASPLQLSDIDEDTDDAEFSDAVEDPSDLEDNGGGFASLDAIVESPLVTPAPVESKARAAEVQDIPESPSTKQAARLAERSEGGESAGNWGQATAYWSQLSREKRQQLEREAMSSDDEFTPPPAIKSRPRQAGAVGAPAPASSLRKSMRDRPGQAPGDDGIHLRSSMRSGGAAPTARAAPMQNAQRPQSAYVEPRGALQKKSMRPMSAAGALPTSDAVTSRPNQSSAYPSIAAKPAPVPRTPQAPPRVSAQLQRELSHDSDSDSSFKKRRRAGPAATDASGRYSMRRSMRGNSIDSTAAPPSIAESARPTSPPASTQRPNTGRNSSFSLRSLSPSGSLFGTRKAEPPRSVEPTTRTTMRGPPASRSAAEPTRTSMRGPLAARGNARTTLRAAPAPAAPARTSAPTSRFKSRFVDSDDSDDDKPAGRSFYKSRFADSDDEDDEPRPLASQRNDLRPVRGIPRRQGQDDGDSTDLDEEADTLLKNHASRRQKMKTPLVPDPADIEKAMAAARRNLGVSEKPAAEQEGSALRQGTLRSKPEIATASTPQASAPTTPMESPKKRGFMGSILRRNRHSSASVQLAAQSQSNIPPSPAIPAAYSNAASPATGAQNTTTSPPATPTAPAKLVRRRSDQPRLSRGNSALSTTTAPPLPTQSDPTTATEIYSSPVANTSQNWPLPPPIPSSSNDGVARPDAIDPDRPNTSDGVSAEAIALARTMRPDLAPRSKSGVPLGNRVRIAAGEEGTEPGERPDDGRAVYSRRTGKKKKFGWLRRGLGIDD